MEQWVREGLSRILEFEIPDDLIKYILSIESESDLNEYMKTLLDFENSQHKNFFIEFIRKKFPPRGVTLQKQPKKKISKNKQQQDFISAEKQPPPQTTEPEHKGKKKTKFVNLYSQEGKNAQVILLKGRIHCDCQASKHELVNNCLQCGRVVCKQEGSGPCLFCGNLVCTPEEQKEINAKTKGGAKLMESLMERSRPKGWESAVLHRDRLLEYDRTSERRTRVTDDDSDYFSANSVWLNATEKQKLQKYQQSLHEKKHASRLNKKMTFDFAGRQIVEDNTIDCEPNEEEIREMTSTSGGGGRQLFNTELFAGIPGDRDVAPGVNAPMLQFDPSVEGQGYATVAKTNPGQHVPRVQDTELQEMSDTGRCLSMHQPWASLLVEGIKLGGLPLADDDDDNPQARGAYVVHQPPRTPLDRVHRQAPDQEVVRALENQYRVLYPDMQLKFPSFYPTGCLLGCVNVDDCLPQEEYQKKYPDGESDSPYVFICSNPTSLKLRFPVKGQHKIYALDKTIHQAAQKCIQKMAKIESAEANAA